MPIDAAGKDHYPAGSSARIVSLVPSLTELLFDLGIGRQVVGRTSNCVEPAGQLSQIEVVGSVKAIDLMKLAELGPSHVLVNVDDTPEAVVRDIVNLGVEVVVTHCDGPDDVLALFSLLGELFGCDEAAEALAGTLRREIELTRAVASGHPARNVIYLTWKNPWISVGPETFTANMLGLAGLSICGVNGPGRFPEVSVDRDLLAETHLVLFSDEPFQFEDEDIQDFQLDHGIGSTPRLEIVEGRALSWCGKRTADGLRELTQLANRL